MEPLVEPPLEPLPVAEPLVPVPPYVEDPLEPFDVSSVVEPVAEPLEPEPVVDPLDPDCARAGTPAKSSPAVPRPATKPHPIFMRLPPCCSVGDGPGTLPWHVVLASIG
jgi:hypothetical protein